MNRALSAGRTQDVFKKILASVLLVSIVITTYIYPAPQKARAATAVVYITAQFSCSWTVPSDWSNASNTIEVIGAGGGGGRKSTANSQNGGGGGGGYAKAVNVTLTPGTNVTCVTGLPGGGGSSDGSAGSGGGDTFLCNSTSNCTTSTDTAVVAMAKGGSGGSGTAGTGGAGGVGSSGIATTTGSVKYSGGAGGGGTTGGAYEGPGGGGAGGPQGVGGAGAAHSGSVLTTTGGGGGGGGGGGFTGTLLLAGAGYGGNSSGNIGGGAGNTSGGTSGAAGNAGTYGGGGSGGNGTTGATAGVGGAGGPGIEWDALHGSGAGGGGGGGTSGATGGAGGAGALYGGGGGGGGYGVTTTGNGGVGGQGIIVITYNTTAIPIAKPHTSITISVPTTVKGNLSVAYNLSKGSGTFVIDHPLDPLNKLLYHSFVESPDAKNIYDGIATLDSSGSATVSLPGYFLALNQDFRYLGTPIAQPMPNLYISGKVRPYFFGLFGTPQFTISGGEPGGRVSWQVTGVRHDVYIEQNPSKTEVDKGPDELVPKGTFLYPELYNADGTLKK